MAKKTTDDDTDQNDGAGTESDDEEEDDTESGTGAADESEEDDEEDEDDEAEIIASLTPAQAKLFTAMGEKLTKANASSRRRRLALKALQQGKAAATQPKPTPQKKDGNGKVTDFDPEAFKAELIASIKGEQEAGRVQTAAEKELRRAGLILPDDEDAAERKLKRVMKMLDLDGATLDDVADEVEDLKADNPELFGRRGKKRPAAGRVGGPARVSGGKAPDKIAELFD